MSKKLAIGNRDDEEESGVANVDCFDESMPNQISQVDAFRCSKNDLKNEDLRGKMRTIS